MPPRGVGGQPMKLRRVRDDGAVTEADIEALDLGNGTITFRVDADVEVGDEVSHVLPNGKTKTMRLDRIDVRQSPFGNMLDHTEASYSVVDQKAVLRQPTPVTLPGLHPLISAASGSQVASRHYDEAVFNAFKAVEDRGRPGPSANVPTPEPRDLPRHRV
jgi:hypothetical protein